MVAGSPHPVQRDRVRGGRGAAAGEGGLPGLGQRREIGEPRRSRSRSTYLNNWDDAALGREAALALIRVKVDVFHHNADAAALGVFQAAKETPGVLVFGANADQSALAPEIVPGSAMIDLPRAFLAVAREVQKGHFLPARDRLRPRGRRGALRAEPEIRRRASRESCGAIAGRTRLDHRRDAAPGGGQMSPRVPLAEVTDYLDGYLRVREVPDYEGAVNGLQVENGGTIDRIIAAVDASQATIDGVAALGGSPLLLVHHGLFFDGNLPVTGRRYRRLRALLSLTTWQSTPRTFRSMPTPRWATMPCWRACSGWSCRGHSAATAEIPIGVWGLALGGGVLARCALGGTAVRPRPCRGAAAHPGWPGEGAARGDRDRRGGDDGQGGARCRARYLHHRRRTAPHLLRCDGVRRERVSRRSLCHRDRGREGAGRAPRDAGSACHTASTIIPPACDRGTPPPTPRHPQAIRHRAGAHGCRSRGARRRSARAAGRERRRQDDADARRERHDRAGHRRDPGRRRSAAPEVAARCARARGSAWYTSTSRRSPR